MPEAKNTFIKSKMNKDLDSRILPEGEYRDAMNVMISKSEGPNVGALENVLGNTILTTFYNDSCNVEIIGKFMDVTNDRIIVFMTNFSDTSSDKLTNIPSTNATCAIGVYDMSGVSPVSTIVVSGNFLNFSKTHPIYGVNVIGDLLFWTDDRNQPRKINLTTALLLPTYYTNEDHISVAKYYPFQPIQLISLTLDSVTMLTSGTGYTNGTYVAETTGGTGSGLRLSITVLLNAVVTATVAAPGTGYSNLDVITIVGGNNDATARIDMTVASTMQDVVSATLPDGTTPNPLLDANWPGDPDYLKDKFARFSYRFKYDDGEYSLIAPFTQDCFVPEQDGYFIGDDETIAYKNTELDFMQNKINNILLIIPSPSPNGWDDVNADLKVEEIDIIYKQSNQSSLKVVETISSSTFSSENSTSLQYTYQSQKPWKTLPTKDLLRIYDQAPVRALGQEVVGNRVVYANFVDKHTPPHTLSYYTEASAKNGESVLDPNGNPYYTRKEYQNHTLKQNRTYQVGVVLCDRYGRQSSVILSDLDASIDTTSKGSTLFHPYKESPFSNVPNGELITGSNTWPGDSLKLTFEQAISSIKSSATGAPGLYNGDTTSADYNPLGWYTYKIVVKQSEQDYYNVYTPGILQGYIDGESKDPTAASASEPIAHFALFGDNINKVPRDLSLLGPTQNSFRTGRPTVNEDPDYYKFVDTAGVLFTVDPYSEEGEALLKARDRERDLDSGSQISNASVKLSPRVVNYGASNLLKQSYPGTLKDTVVTIGTGTELGLWDPSANMPYNTAPVFYSYKTNPYIAKVEVSSWGSGDKDSEGVTGPSPTAGKYNYKCVFNAGGVASYIAGSKSVSTEPYSTIPAQYPEGVSGLLINIDGVDDGGLTGDPGTVGALIANGCSIANPDGAGIKGFNDVMADGVTEWLFNVMAGSNTGRIGTVVTKDTWPGNMSPTLAVYETEPLESKLDIYWETSTAGEISNLNDKIISTDILTPKGFCTILGNELTPALNEGLALNSNILTSNIYVQNAAGGVLSSVLSVNYFSCIDGTGTSRVSDFKFGTINADNFQILTNSYLWYNSSAHSSGTGDFTFVVNVTVPGPNYATEGTVITLDVPFGFWNTATSTLIPYNVELANIAPTITQWPNIPGNVYEIVGGPTAPIASWQRMLAVNGSNTSGPYENEGLSWDIIVGNNEGYLSIDPIPYAPEALLKASAGAVFDERTVIIRVTDPGYLTNTVSFKLKGVV